jgi:transcriptional regulator with XRE-family HTH domain
MFRPGKESRYVAATLGHEGPGRTGTAGPGQAAEGRPAGEGRPGGDSGLAADGGLAADRTAAEEALELGQRIRQVRRKKKKALREVAEAAGVSESFLSQVERGLANPSVASLRRIANAIREPVGSFFIGDPPQGMLVRAGDRRRLIHSKGVLEDYLLTPPTARSLQIIYCVVGAGEGSGPEPYAHPADEECLVVLSGRLDVGIGSETYQLSRGDALLLDPNSPHSFANPGIEPATMLWVQTPPSY